ncbi:hypothetical protein N431DRAFT_455373 [Stipitochalara longipes BDJ]|nr:hypothetical protein N431DRAFT_455373 [Stipitochalara longipes BDJ]
MPANPNDTQPKWRRMSVPRTKTGCHNCRRRHLKCDEAKPTCLRCVRSHLTCEGYIEPRRAANELYKTTTRSLLPRGPTPGLSIVRPLGNLLTRNEVESRYLKDFHNKSSSGLDGILNWSIWNHLVLQLSNHEPFIHDSCVAIGALMKAVDINESELEDEASSSTLHIAKMHREFALLKYGKAVKQMQEALIDAELRLVLVACLLVFCFENLLSNRFEALAHVTSVQPLLRAWLAKYDQVMPGNQRLHSPAPLVVDEELVEAFNHLDLQISTIYDPRPIEAHRAAIREGFSAVKNMPAIFHDLTEAQSYLMAVMRRCHHFLATTWPSSEAHALTRDFDLLPPEDVIVTTGINIWSTSYRVSDILRVEQKEFADDIRRWSHSFQPLFEFTRQPENIGSRSHLVATLLRIHAITTTIIVAGVLFTEEVAYDAFLSDFQELFDLATIVVEAHRKKSGQTHKTAGFFLDLGITAPLYLLVNRCRDHSLRVDAIELLRGWHVEASWHPRCIAEIGDFMMDIEEDGNAGGFIPEKSRAVFTAICEEPQRQIKHEAVIQCVQRYGGPDGGPIWHERRVFF